ncbi:uncharacterized protein LOC118735774 [Rhagoletis pomonella]|uniref:uncharacterized protein LOC118735774 n=1 Tax=Rhagoletis pomonella TaxID=28610 RepID=UPI001780219D|nr:uncharacterized protein LOC118735774 [Rhagoletis pomonella]
METDEQSKYRKILHILFFVLITWALVITCELSARYLKPTFRTELAYPVEPILEEPVVEKPPRNDSIFYSPMVEFKNRIKELELEASEKKKRRRYRAGPSILYEVNVQSNELQDVSYM